MCAHLSNQGFYVYFASKLILFLQFCQFLSDNLKSNRSHIDIGKAQPTTHWDAIAKSFCRKICLCCHLLEDFLQP